MAEATNLVRHPLDEQPDGRSAEEIRRDIAGKRESIKATLDQLNDRVDTALDWRSYVGNYPIAALGAAAGLGFLLSRSLRPRRSTGERIVDALADGVEGLTGRFSGRIQRLVLKKMGAGGMIKAVTTAIATKAVNEYVKKSYAERTEGDGESLSR